MNNEEQNLNQSIDQPIESLESSDVIEQLSVDPSIGQVVEPSVSQEAKADIAPIKRRKFNPKLMIILVLLIIAIGAFVAYEIFMNNPYNIYRTFITKSFNEAQDVIEDQIDFTNPVSISGNVKVETNIETFKDLNDYSFDYGMGVDVQNNKMELMLGLKEKEKSLLDAFIYLLDNKVYLKSEKLYEKLILAGEEEVDLVTLADVSNKDNIKYIYNTLEKAFLNALTKEDLKSTNTKIEIASKKVSVKESYVILTPENIGKVVERFINTIKADEKALELISKMTETDREELISMFDDILATDYSETEGEVRVSLYTKPFINKLVGLSVKVDGVEVINAAIDNDKGQIVITLEEMVATFDINGNVATYKITENDEVIISGTISISDNGTNIDVIVEGMTVTLAINSKKESETVTSETLTVTLLNPEDGSQIRVTINNKIELNKSISDIETNGAKDINQMTDFELEKIMNKFQTIIEPTAIYGLIESLFKGGYEGGNSSFVDPNCENAVCKNCSGDFCECEYYDNTFTLQTVTCPNNAYY